MSQNPFTMDESFSQAVTEPQRPNRLSQNGQTIAILVYGSLVLAGFFFGIVTGYAPSARPEPKPVPVAKKEPEPVRPTPKPSPKITPSSEPKPEPSTEPEPEPKLDPKPELKPDPKPEPKADTRPKPEPKPEPDPEPKVEPKKIDAPPKKEDMVAVKAVSFEKDVKPILRTYCFNCHGAAGKPKGDVDLTSLAAIFDPKNPKIVEPGNPKASALLLTIEDMSMPPQGPRPGKGETEIIRNWILSGAKP